MTKRLNTRAAAAKLSWQIIDKGQSLDTAISTFFESTDYSPQDRGFIQELVYGVCRWFGELDAVAATLLRSPIRNKDRIIHFVLLVGLYQLRHLETAEHAGVAETVSACKQLDKQWAKNVINGCLRNYLRAPSDLNTERHKLSHPEWMQQAIQLAWPQYSDTILTANNQRPPMCLRINSIQNSRDDYLSQLKSAGIDAVADHNAQDGIILATPCAVSALPGFGQGSCSVQDTAAQISADLIDAKAGMSILDACAAPGGKTAPDWKIPNDGYDRILIDAPCSGLGVIRRHPDIKHHRRLNDIDALEAIQASLLDNLWHQLKPGGIMLYMTCSILPRENELQIERFVTRTNDAMLKNIQHPNALSLKHGAQTLPGVHDMDGFYYCVLQKNKHFAVIKRSSNAY